MIIFILIFSNVFDTLSNLTNHLNRTPIYIYSIYTGYLSFYTMGYIVLWGQ